MFQPQEWNMGDKAGVPRKVSCGGYEKEEYKKMKKVIIGILAVTMVMVLLSGCEVSETNDDISRQQKVTDTLSQSQQTPTDVDYSLERYNLIRRTYWVNGQREKANSLPCEIEKPLGYIVLFTDNGSIVGKFVVDGKVSSLNSFLTPNTIDEYITDGGVKTIELADVDGSYGENDSGIFFFDIQGNYIEWTGTYLYTDIPMEISDPVIEFSVDYDEVEE